MSQFSYFKTLKESFQLVFKNYVLFVPFVLFLLLGVVAIPFQGSLNFENGFSVQKVILFVFLVLFSVIITFITYGWLFALVRNVVQKKKANLSGSFSEGLPLAWKYFKINLALMVLFFVVAIVIFLIAVLGALLYLIPVVGILLVALLILAGVILFLAAILALGYLIPIMILEKVGAFESIKLNYIFFMKHKGHTVKMGLISILGLILVYLPSLAVQFQIILASFHGQVIKPTLLQSLSAQLLSIPIFVVYAVIIMFYTLAYLKIKKNSKEKSVQN